MITPMVLYNASQIRVQSLRADMESGTSQMVIGLQNMMFGIDVEGT
jgi:hypothetical protein